MTEEAAAEEWLPPGWTAEISVRKSGKKDRHYFDPQGNKYNSKPEVLRYLKSIESIPEPESKRRTRRNHLEFDSSAIAEQEKLTDNKTNGKKIENQSLKQANTSQDEKVHESCAGGKETSVSDQKEKKQSCEPNGAVVLDIPSKNILEVEKTIGTKSKNKNKKPELPRRASKRLAGVEVGPVPELSPVIRTRRVSKQIEDKDAAIAKSSLDDIKTTVVEDNKHDFSSEDSSMPKDPNLGEEFNKDKIDDMAGASIEVPLPDIWKDPCIEFAIKTLTGQIPIEEVLGKDKTVEKVPEPSKESSSGDFWGDPCIDFAVKTLTSDLPVPNFNIQNYLQNLNK